MYLCPYCYTLSVPAPPDTPHPHATCSTCGKSPRYDKTRNCYVRDGRKASEPTEAVTVRLYRRQVEKYRDANLSEVIRNALDKAP